MTTDKQIEANRANAKKSTGPKSKAGKKISRRNALSHGLTGEVIFLPGEYPEAYKQLRKEFFAEFAPSSRYEKELVERLASLAWRLRRIPNFEAAMLEYAGSLEDFGAFPKSSRTILWLGHAVSDTLANGWFAKLSRYERRLMRQYKQTLAELNELWEDSRSRVHAQPAITIDHDEA